MAAAQAAPAPPDGAWHEAVDGVLKCKSMKDLTTWGKEHGFTPEKATFAGERLMAVEFMVAKTGDPDLLNEDTLGALTKLWKLTTEEGSPDSAAALAHIRLLKLGPLVKDMTATQLRSLAVAAGTDPKKGDKNADLMVRLVTISCAAVKAALVKRAPDDKPSTGTPAGTTGGGGAGGGGGSGASGALVDLTLDPIQCTGTPAEAHPWAPKHAYKQKPTVVKVSAALATVATLTTKVRNLPTLRATDTSFTELASSLFRAVPVLLTGLTASGVPVEAVTLAVKKIVAMQPLFTSHALGVSISTSTTETSSAIGAPTLGPGILSALYAAQSGGVDVEDAFTLDNQWAQAYPGMITNIIRLSREILVSLIKTVEGMSTKSEEKKMAVVVALVSGALSTGTLIMVGSPQAAVDLYFFADDALDLLRAAAPPSFSALAPPAAGGADRETKRRIAALEATLASPDSKRMRGAGGTPGGGGGSGGKADERPFRTIPWPVENPDHVRTAQECEWHGPMHTPSECRAPEFAEVRKYYTKTGERAPPVGKSYNMVNEKRK